MKVDFVVKDAWVFLTYRQCFEKRDVAVARGKDLRGFPCDLLSGRNNN